MSKSKLYVIAQSGRHVAETGTGTAAKTEPGEDRTRCRQVRVGRASDMGGDSAPMPEERKRPGRDAQIFDDLLIRFYSGL